MCGLDFYQAQNWKFRKMVQVLKRKVTFVISAALKDKTKKLKQQEKGNRAERGFTEKGKFKQSLNNEDYFTGLGRKGG